MIIRLFGLWIVKAFVLSCDYANKMNRKNIYATHN